MFLLFFFLLPSLSLPYLICFLLIHLFSSSIFSHTSVRQPTTKPVGFRQSTARSVKFRQPTAYSTQIRPPQTNSGQIPPPTASDSTFCMKTRVIDRFSGSSVSAGHRVFLTFDSHYHCQQAPENINKTPGEKVRVSGFTVFF
ncbi:hypothetical protein ABFX02_05G081700 [Erythranthe guttata]